LTYQ